VEAHGPHSPLSTDLIISEGICARATSRLDGDPEVRVLTLPAIPYAVTRYAAAFPGTISITDATLRALLTDICTSLAAQGFLRVIVVNNHFEPDHVTAIRRTVDALQADGIRTEYLNLLSRDNVNRLTEEFRSGSCHAGRYETSLVLADRPTLVDTDTMHTLEPHFVDMPTEMRSGNTTFADMGMEDAYCGTPAEATAEEGHATFDTLTAMLITKIRALAKD
jgi:creatinine amidohydrolase